jgi:hypothetical protein
MTFNTIIRSSVGADLSALGGFPDIPIKKLICMIAPAKQKEGTNDNGSYLDAW